MQPKPDRVAGKSERTATVFICAALLVTSVALMLLCASPELAWDEADYALSATKPWASLWNQSIYRFHGHGPMAIYLAKLGLVLIPPSAASLETRLRFFTVLVASLSVAFLYVTLRRTFETSRSAALAGSSLLLFSVIRLQETPVIGPHHLMLACTLAIAGLGYRWRDRPGMSTAIALGVVMGLGAMSMTYVVPAALCWIVAVAVVPGKWITVNRSSLKVSWAILPLVATAVVVVIAGWPPGVLHLVFLHDFKMLINYGSIPTLVGDHLIEVTPRSAALYWFSHLDAPTLVISLLVIVTGFWKAFRSGSISARHRYLAVFIVFFLATALLAHLAGARNLLQFAGILCLAAGALFDEALGNSKLIRWGSSGTAVAAALNLLWLVKGSAYIAFPATDGYQALLRERGDLVREKANAVVYGSPVLSLYSEQSGATVGWNVAEMAWTTRANAPLPPDTRYVLIPEFVYSYMPADQPMRSVVAARWTILWEYKGNDAWGLRLYAKPGVPAP